MKREISSELLGKIIDDVKAHDLICGVDEVGRGPLAGPVVACAIIMPKNSKVEGVKDSKKLSEKKRIKLDLEIRSQAIAIGIGIVDNDVIDDINIRQATLLAMKLAVKDLKDLTGKYVNPDVILVDNEIIDVENKQYSIVHGDDTFYEIACASIVAKVFRDELMVEFSKEFNQYSFEKNKGYGTKAHYEGLNRVGLSPIHRKTFLKNFEKH